MLAAKQKCEQNTGNARSAWCGQPSLHAIDSQLLLHSLSLLTYVSGRAIRPDLSWIAPAAEATCNRWGRVAPVMTLLELPTAAAGAWIVALDAGKGAFQNRHHLPGLAPAPDQAGHDLHGKIHVVEERFEPGAQVIQARFAVRRFDAHSASGLRGASQKRFFGHSP